jgi:hypothetical protein
MKKQAIGFNSLPKAVQSGFKRIVAEERPFMLAPFNWIAGKAFGKKKVDEAYWKVMSPIIKADTWLGSAAQKITPTKGLKKLLWEHKVVLPTERGAATGVEYSVPALSAPIKKVGPLGIGMLGTMKAEELLKERKKMSNKPIIKEADLKKAAEMLTCLKGQNSKLKKEAKATELLYKQAEMGQIQFPKSYAEFQEKVAELSGKNLDVVEEAIKMASSAEADTLGGLDGEPVKGDPRSMFARSILEN